MAQQVSLFPTQFEFDNDTWFLHYDPANPVTVKPDLKHAQMVSANCDEVVTPNGSKKLWQVSVLFVIPPQALASGTITAERRILGVRFFDYDEKPARIEAVNPNDLLYYVAKPRFDADTNKAQALFNILIGQAYANQQRQQAEDRDWAQRLVGDMVPKRRRGVPTSATEEPVMENEEA